MKTYIQLVAFFAIISSSTFVFAQQKNPTIADEPVIRTYSGLRSAAVDTSFKADLMLTKPIKAFPFSYQFPTIKLANESSLPIATEPNATYRYNMPIARPEKTSKILIAKLDPNFPYSYNMPILKN